MEPTEQTAPEQTDDLQQITSTARVRDTNEWLPGSTGSDILKATRPAGVKEEGYYGVPMLKRPLWHWHIALYFFFEGASAGAFLLASLADLFGDEKLRRLSRAGYYVALLGVIPCPPLLIADLGVPSKFHHMLRVFKPSSPMNLGAWALTGYSIPLQIIALRLLAEHTNILPKWLSKLLLKLLPQRLAGIMGIPFAFLMVCYPGVLLSTTSNPLWARTRLLGGLFSASSMSTGVAATSLALALMGGDNDGAFAKLKKIGTAASLVEGAAMAGYFLTTGQAAEPLLEGNFLGQTLLAGASVAAHLLPSKSSESKPSKSSEPAKKPKRGLMKTFLGSALTLAGGLALKWAIVHAGRKSAEDPKAAREATRPSKSAPGWGPSTQRD